MSQAYCWNMINLTSSSLFTSKFLVSCISNWNIFNKSSSHSNSRSCIFLWKTLFYFPKLQKNVSLVVSTTLGWNHTLLTNLTSNLVLVFFLSYFSNQSVFKCLDPHTHFSTCVVRWNLFFLFYFYVLHPSSYSSFCHLRPSLHLV